MERIRKITKNMKTVAGSALLVGATLTAGAAAVTAQDSGSSGSLSDYPSQFVTEDGEVDTSIVVGKTATDGEPVSTLDVVGAAEIAGSLANNAFVETEESVSVEGTSSSWSAQNGVTLNRANSNLFLNDNTNAEETRFDGEDINILETSSVTTESGEDVELDFEVNMGTQPQEFDTAGDLENPVLQVNNPTSPSVGSSLFDATVDFDQTMDFSTTNPDNANGNNEILEDGDEVNLFGQTFTYSSDSDDSELVLYGSSETFDVSTDAESASTITVDGEEQTFETVTVNGDANPTTATVRVNGQLENVEETDDIRVNGQDVRVRDIFSTGSDGQGLVQFAVGSQEVVISDGDVEVNGDSVDGVDVQINDGDSNVDAVDSLTFGFGAADSDEEYVAAGSSYEDPLFGLEFHYGGLSADVMENPAETVEVTAQEEDNAVISTTTEDGEEADITFVDYDNNQDDQLELAADTDEEIATYEGQALEEDDYVILNQNEEAAMYQVTDISASDLNNADEGDLSLTLDNVHTGESVTVEEDEIGDFDTADTHELTDQSIEGNDFNVEFDTSATDPTVSITGSDTTDALAVYPAFYTESGAAQTFTETVDVEQAAGITGYGSAPSNVDVRLPSTVSSNEKTATFSFTDTDGGDNTNAVTASGSTITVEYGGDTDTGGAATSDSATVRVGQVEYRLDVEFADSSTDSTPTSVEWSVDSDQSQDGAQGVSDPSALFVQPEDDEENEDAYLFTPDVSTGGDIAVEYTNADAIADKESSDFEEDGITAGYNLYGAYAELDTDDTEQESFTLNLPAAQSTVGMALTGPEGSLSAEGGSASGSVTSVSPTYSFADAYLDTDVDAEGDIRQNQNLILVGGPSVNSLVEGLAEDNMTMTADEYTAGQGMIQHIPDAFSDGQDAVIVAGYAGEDTRAAAEFLASYRDNQGALEGETQVTIDTESQSVVQ